MVTKVYGTRNVDVRVMLHGPTWRRHIEQLRLWRGSTEDADLGELPPMWLEPEAPSFEAPQERPKQRNP